MRIATIDVGTNTALLLIASVENGRLQVLHEAERFVRLGTGVDASGMINDEALGRLRAVLRAYRDEAARWEVEQVVVVGTSASRDARNRDDLVAYVHCETGLEYEILSGEDEARWSFVGAVSAFDAPPGRCAVVDIGGGSTEIVVGEPGDGALYYRQSLQVGSVRLAERFFAVQPPAAGAVARAEAWIRAALEACDAPLEPAWPLLAVAGTATTLALVNGGASEWNRLGPADTELTAERVTSWRDRLLVMDYEAVRSLAPQVMAGRADVFPAGVLILDVLMRHFGLRACRVVPRSLRHGLALRAAGGRT